MSNESKRCSSIRPKSFLNVKVMNMTYCFVCQREIDLEINWLNLFSIKKESPLCIECEKQYKRISGSRCKRCSRRSKSSDRKSTRLNSSHVAISYAVFCLKKKKQ